MEEEVPDNKIVVTSIFSSAKTFYCVPGKNFIMRLVAILFSSHQEVSTMKKIYFS